MVAVTTLVGLQGDSSKHSPAGFGRVASAWFLGLAALYVSLHVERLPGTGKRLVGSRETRDGIRADNGRVFLLISPAVFAAALERFRPLPSETPARRGAHWAHLALFALVAYSLAVLGPQIAVSLMPVALIGTPKDALVAYETLATTRLLIPLAMGLLTLCSGVAGGLVGHATTSWRPRRRDTARWLACLALIASFLVPSSLRSA